MVLHTRGRVGRRQLFYKPLSTDLLREAFLCVSFWEGASSPELVASRPHLGATRFPQVRTRFLLACAGQINEKD